MCNFPLQALAAGPHADNTLLNPEVLFFVLDLCPIETGLFLLRCVLAQSGSESAAGKMRQ
eukprot:COSAG01_NODE_29126_length_644_cov_8.045872_1_plen_60_part_00